MCTTVPIATYPLIDSGNGPTPNFPAGGYYGQTIPGPFTSTHPSGALTFVFRSDFGVTRAGWEADIVCGPLSVSDQVFEDFSYYPNPVASQLNLKAAFQIESVQIFNMLGQRVLSVNPNTTNPAITLDGLQTATYIMKVAIDGNEKAYQILKQ